MNKKLPLIDQSGEVRELTRKDLSEFKSASEVLPSTLIKNWGYVARKSLPKRL